MKETGTFFPETTAPILLATDGSLQAERATQAAIELADATGSELHLVHVGVIPNFLGNGPGTIATTVCSTIRSSGKRGRRSGS